jgi:hypothetical protein
MRKVETRLYQFDELSDEAKERAREWYRNGALDYDWWDSTYEDAENVDLKITSFDLDRHEIEGKFTHGALETAHKIEDDHGDTCETFKTTKAFLAERDAIVNDAPRDENGEFESVHELDALLDECEAEFLKSLLEDYRIMLQHEMEYLLSDESVDETIRCNEYEFTADGERCTCATKHMQDWQVND